MKANQSEKLQLLLQGGPLRAVEVRQHRERRGDRLPRNNSNYLPHFLLHGNTVDANTYRARPYNAK